MSLSDKNEVSPAPVDESQPVSRVRMLVAYNGAGFHGFAIQSGVRTVAGELTAMIEKILGQAVEITCAGRTDTGVHAWGQVIHFDVTVDVDPAILQKSLNKMLGGEVVIRKAGLSDAEFHARFSATERRYRYTVLNTDVPDPFLMDTAWHVEQPLDIRAMNVACDALIGEHEFSSFCKKPDNDSSLVRNVYEAQWHDEGNGVLVFEIRASSFCHQMVRAITGTLVEMGLGKKKPGDMLHIIRSQDRKAAGQLAPPQGLVLWHVGY